MNNLETPKIVRIIAAAAAAVTTFGIFHGVFWLAEPSYAPAGQTQMAQATVPAPQWDGAAK